MLPPRPQLGFLASQLFTEHQLCAGWALYKPFLSCSSPQPRALDTRVLSTSQMRNYCSGGGGALQDTEAVEWPGRSPHCKGDTPGPQVSI